MGVSRVINRRTAVLGLLLVILATAGFGFAASNTVDDSSAGDGAGAITGFDITNIDYVLSSGDPAVISEVHFDLVAQAGGSTTPPDSVAAKLDTDSADWYDCTYVAASSPFRYECDNGATTAADANELRVVAAD